MFLEKINSPKDLKKLQIKDLPILAQEIRNLIIDTTINKTGGHLASSLGAVDFTIALHYVFQAPKDKFIWDVGHQAYAHKILTGRKDRFAHLRQYKGLNGFIDPNESIYDLFHVGHAGTSLSLATGVLKARDLLKRNYTVLPIIGDASFSAGMALEAMNHLGHNSKQLIIILNDNEMSISKNSGAFSDYFNKLITSPFYNRFKNRTGSFVKKIPLIGKFIVNIIDKFQEILKGLIVPATVFEELGFRYVGPINGHNIELLVQTFQKIKLMKDKPLLIHLITKKGKGYKPAEEDPTTYHGVSVSKSELPSYTKIFSDTIVKLGKKDKKIVAITAAMRDGTGLKQFSELFPNRFFDVGIAEQHAVTFAAGLAKNGMKPFVSIYSTFLQRAYDQVIHDVALPELPVKFILDRAGIVGADGPTHNGTYDISYLTAIPNIVLLSPKNGRELQDLVYSIAEYNKGPVAIRYPRGAVHGSDYDKSPRKINFFKNEIITEGKDVLIFSTGSILYEALEAIEILKKKKKTATLVNCRSIKPLDEKNILDLSKSIKKIVTLEENVLHGGFGSSINELLLNKGIRNIQIRNIALPDKFIEVGSQNILRKKYGLTAESIAKTTLNMLGVKL